MMQVSKEEEFIVAENLQHGKLFLKILAMNLLTWNIKAVLFWSSSLNETGPAKQDKHFHDENLAIFMHKVKKKKRNALGVPSFLVVKRKSQMAH